MFSDYWLCIITTKPRKVKQDVTKDTYELTKGDVYFYVQWLDFDFDKPNGSRHFVFVGDKPEIVVNHGSVVPVKIGKKFKDKLFYDVTIAKHEAVMARLQVSRNLM